LVTNTGNDNIFELESTTGNVVWSYSPPVGTSSIFKAIRYLANDVELSNYNLIPSQVILL